MDYITQAIADHLLYIVAGLCVVCLVLLCLSIALAVCARGHRKRMDRFFGTRSERRNLEAILQELKAHMVETNRRYDALVADVNDKQNAALADAARKQHAVLADAAEKYEGVLALIDNINERLRFCVQRVGVVRYNPFEHMGGDQSFAVALLDEQSNGVVFSAIHGRDASYTYVKPVVGGESSYALTAEERRAIARAANQNKLVASYPD